jgi:hypothetical protein
MIPRDIQQVPQRRTSTEPLQQSVTVEPLLTSDFQIQRADSDIIFTTSISEELLHIEKPITPQTVASDSLQMFREFLTKEDLTKEKITNRFYKAID